MTVARSGQTTDTASRQAFDDETILPNAEPLERPPWLLAFLCVLIAILPSYSVLPGPLKSNGSPARLIAIALLGLVVLGFVLKQRTHGAGVLRPGIVLILVYFSFMLLIFGVALSRKGSALADAGNIRGILTVMACAGVALYTMIRIKTSAQHSLLLGCLAVGLTFNCVAALMQALVHIDIRLLFQPPGFVDNSIANSADLAERFGVLRATGTSGHPIELSVLAAITVPLAIHFARYATRRQVRLLAAAAVGIALFAMVASVSRSGVLTLAAALSVYVWGLTLRQIGNGVIAAIVVILFQILMVPRNAQALWNTIINSAEDDSISSRTADYATVSQTFREHPLFGLGLGGSDPQEYGYLDNQWLQYIVQGGIVGVLAMLVIFLGGVFGISAALRCATTERERDQAYTIGAMLTGILMSSVSFDLFSYQQATLIFFILIGLLWSNFGYSIPRTNGPKIGCMTGSRRSRISAAQQLSS